MPSSGAPRQLREPDTGSDPEALDGTWQVFDDETLISPTTGTNSYQNRTNPSKEHNENNYCP